MIKNATYRDLPSCFYQLAEPDVSPNPELVIFNESLADELGFKREDLASWMSGEDLPEDIQPIAQAYAGHQFGQLNMLGDGRALLLGEIEASARRVDLQLKGSGKTAYSRQGDGKANLAPMLREYLISESMHALNIPTTRSLAVLKTGEAVRRREHRQGAVLARVASSHIRVGTFAYAAMMSHQSQNSSITSALVDFTIQRHFPDLVDVENPALALLDAVIERQAYLVAHWQRVGFVHGVLNTDNVTVSGETIDYGPCAFMEAYDLKTVFSSIDSQGRYAFGNQPQITQWNLARFAETLLPLIEKDEQYAIDQATQSLNKFEDYYTAHWNRMLTAKIGLKSEQVSFAEALLELLSERRLDYTNSFVSLTQVVMGMETSLPKDDGLDSWISAWRGMLRPDSLGLMQTHNPVVIPRNHLVESALLGAEQGELTEFFSLHKMLQSAYDWDNMSAAQHFQMPASQEWYDTYQTFCGT